MPPLPDADAASRLTTRSTRCFITLNALAGGSNRWPYSEYRAFGHPSEEVGLPGDLYLNTKPGYHELFARYPEGWKKWPGPEDVESTLVHPEHPDRYLWLKSDMSTFGWYSKKSLLTLSKNLTISELLCLVLKEQVRVAESNAARKRKKQNNEDMPEVSSPAKKSRGIGSSNCEVLANAIPQKLLSSQAPGSIVPYPMSLSAPAHMPSSSDTAGSVGLFPSASQYQSLTNSGLTKPAVKSLTASMIQHYHAHHPVNSSHIPSASIDPTALTGPSTLLQEHHIRERALSKTHSMEPGPSQVHALSGSTAITSISDSRLSDDEEVTPQIPLPHPINVAALQEISRLRQENQLLRERLSRYNPHLLGIRDHDAAGLDNIPQDHAGSHDSSPEFTEGPATLPSPEDAAVVGYPSPASRDHTTEVEDDQTRYQSTDAQCGSDRSRSLLSTSTAPLASPHPTTFPPSRDKNSGTVEPHTPSPVPEVGRSAAVTSEKTPIDDIVMLQRSTSRQDVSILASSSRNTESEKQTSTQEMRTKSPLTEETAIGGPSCDARHLTEGRRIPHPSVPMNSENSRKSIEPTAEVPHRLNQSHFTIMFHISASDMVCRLCLQKRVIFHLKTSSTFHHLQEHCEKKHREICDHLLAKTDRELSEMNRQLSACEKST